MKNEKTLKLLENMIRRIIKEQQLTETVNYNSVLKSLGVGNISKIPKDGQFHSLGQKNIDPSELGPFAPAIAQMSVSMRAGWRGSGIAHIELDYSYKHPSGSNGYTVNLYSKDNGKTWTTKHPNQFESDFD